MDVSAHAHDFVKRFAVDWDCEAAYDGGTVLLDQVHKVEGCEGVVDAERGRLQAFERGFVREGIRDAGTAILWDIRESEHPV
jgi:hypothetical protein